MNVITVEEHYMSKCVNEQYTKATTSIHTTPQEQAKAAFIQQYVEQDGGISEVGEKRIAYMNRCGVDVQIIGYGNNNPMDLNAKDAIPLCRMANDDLAADIAKYPDRFYGFASLPVADPNAAAIELKRCVTTLGFKGAMLAGTFQGKFFDAPEFYPIFEKAAALHVPVSLHPGEVDSAITQHYYVGNWSSQVTTTLAGHGFGWHADAGIHILRLILSGLFDQLPDLTLISGHWGEMIPYFFERLDETLPMSVTGLKQNISDYFKTNIYVSPSGMFYDAPFQLCLHSIGADRILWSMDYPYMMREQTKEYLMNMPITQKEKELIAHQNAESLFHI